MRVEQQFHAVVLAAGASTRFGGGTHKALAPLVGSEGTLSLLLGRLAQDRRCTGVTVVTGAFREAVEASCATSRLGIPLRTVHNPEFLECGPLHSLTLALDGLEPQNLWVYLADTYYEEPFLARLWRPAAAAAAVCVVRPDRPVGTPPTAADVPVAVIGADRLDLSGVVEARGAVAYGEVAAHAAADVGAGDAEHGDAAGGSAAARRGIDGGRWATMGPRVRGIGPGHLREFEMAPAVGWSARSWPHIIAADAAGWRMQWEAIARVIDAEPHGVAAVEVPSGSFFDVDTPEDLARGRQELARRGIG